MPAPPPDAGAELPKEGTIVVLPFAVTADEMRKFLELSGDTSLSHTDESFCRQNGFDGIVVYGGLLTARLSNLLGCHLPGQLGLSHSWEIHFHHPLYVGQAAELRAEVVHSSAATRTILLSFEIVSQDRRLASGKAQSMYLRPPS